MLALWIAWAVLTVVVISLAVARKVTARKEDDYVHLADSETAAVSQQVSVGRKLDKIDYWGKTLTVADLLFGLVLVAVMCYNAWQSANLIK